MTWAEPSELWLKSLLLAAAGLLAVLALARRSPVRRCTIWTALAATLLLLPPAVALLPEVPIEVAGVAPAADAYPRATIGTNTGAIASPPARRAAEADAASAISTVAPRTSLAAIIWLAGMVALGAAMLRWSAAARRLRARSLPCSDDRIRDACARVARRMGLTRLPEIRFGAPETAPFTAGSLHPWIHLPADALAWSADELEAVLAHECAHVRLGHFASRRLGQLALLVNWPNPLIWLVLRRHVQDQELACDDLTLASGIDPIRYAGAIVAAARRTCVTVRAPAMSGSRPLHMRVQRILEHPGNAARWSRRACALLATAGLSAVIGIGGVTIAETPIEQDTSNGQPPADVRPGWTAVNAGDHSAIRRLRIAVRSGSLRFVDAGAGETEIRVRMTRAHEHGTTPVDDPLLHLDVQQRGGELFLGDRHDDDASRPLTVTVETRLAAGVAVDARVDSGHIVVAAGAGTVFASCGEGEVRVSLPHVVLDTLQAHAGEGRVQAAVGGVRRAADLSVGEGAIDAALLRVAPTRLDVHGGEAEIDVRLPGDTRCTLEGAIGEGPVRVHGRAATGGVRSTAGAPFRIAIGEGVSRPYRLECGLGRIDVRFVE